MLRCSTRVTLHMSYRDVQVTWLVVHVRKEQSSCCSSQVPDMFHAPWKQRSERCFDVQNTSLTSSLTSNCLTWYGPLLCLSPTLLCTKEEPTDGHLGPKSSCMRHHMHSPGTCFTPACSCLSAMKACGWGAGCGWISGWAIHKHNG